MAHIVEEKTAIGRVDDHSSSADSITVDPKNADDAIVHDLQTQGEEVGLTWRTIMAVVVSFCLFAHFI
jgi:hypothetical protein